MIDNTLYYTFSTIAQSLAGTLAVLAAFVLFRLAGIEYPIRQVQTMLRHMDASVPYVQSWAAFRERGWPGVHDLFQMIPGWPAPSGMRENCEAGYVSYRLWPEVRPRIGRALHFTVTDIALCLVALPFTRLLLQLLPIAVAAIALTVGLALFCLWLYVNLVTALVARLNC
jgi:hypothetical protein